MRTNHHDYFVDDGLFEYRIWTGEEDFSLPWGWVLLLLLIYIFI